MNPENLQALLEQTTESIDYLDKICTSAEFNAQRHPLKMNNLATSEEFLKGFQKVSTNMGKFTSQLQSTSLTDKFTSWFGLFDKEIKALKAKKSELLAKKDVRNYVYKRHYWNYYYISAIPNNVFYFINNILANTKWALTQAELGNYTVKELTDICNDWINMEYDPDVCKYLYGKKPKILYNKLCAVMLGDGLKVITKTFNFQDDMSISRMIEICDMFGEYDFVGRHNYTKGAIKDIDIKIKGIMKDFANITKGNKNANVKKFAANRLKICATYIALLISKLNEFNDADCFCFKTVIEEDVKVLKGLLNYNGN